MIHQEHIKTQQYDEQLLIRVEHPNLRPDEASMKHHRWFVSSLTVSVRTMDSDFQPTAEASKDEDQDVKREAKGERMLSSMHGLQPGSMFTFVDQVLGLQVEALPVTLLPEPGDGGVKLPAAVRLHGGRRGHEVPLLAHERSCARAAASPLRAPLRRHLDREVVARNVDVTGVVPFVGVVLTPLPVSPGVGLVPVVGADRHGEESERAHSQEETCAREDFHSGHLLRSTESPKTVTRRFLRGRGGAGAARGQSTTALRASRGPAPAA